MDEIVAEYRDILFNQFREKVLEEGRAEERQSWEQWQKEVVHTLSLKGYTSYEIAEILKVSQATVETWLDEQC